LPCGAIWQRERERERERSFLGIFHNGGLTPPAPCSGAQVLLFTSVVIFPLLTILEFVENIFFPPGKQPRPNHSTGGGGGGGGGGGAILLTPGTMCSLDGIVTHRSKNSQKCVCNGSIEFI
jgi:hypothetical protein